MIEEIGIIMKGKKNVWRVCFFLSKVLLFGNVIDKRMEVIRLGYVDYFRLD